METKCTIFKIESASPCTYIWYPATSHQLPAAMQAGPAASSPLPCSHLCPPSLIFTCSQRDPARTYIRPCLTSTQNLQVAPWSSPWVQGPTGPGPHCLADLITHPSLSLTLLQPMSFLTSPQTDQPASTPGPLHWLLSLPEAFFLHKSPDSLLYLLQVCTSVLSDTLTTIPPHSP